MCVWWILYWDKLTSRNWNVLPVSHEWLRVYLQIVQQHQKRRLAKSDTSSSDTKESTTSVFSDRDFDKFEKEYVFWVLTCCIPDIFSNLFILLLHIICKYVVCVVIFYACDITGRSLLKVCYVHCSCGSKNPFFLKPNPLSLLGCIGFLDFSFEWAVGKLVGWFTSSAKLLFRFSITYTLSWNSQIHYLLVVKSWKYKEIFNYYAQQTKMELSMMQVYCWVFQWVIPKIPGGFWVLP